MAAVISLLSSSPPLPPSPVVRRDSLPGGSRALFDVRENDFDALDISDIELEPPLKKVRLSRHCTSSPSLHNNKTNRAKHRKDASSDLEDLSRLLKTSKRRQPDLKSKKHNLESDPIEFSSSAPQLRAEKGKGAAMIVSLSDDDESGSDDDLLVTLSQPTVRSTARLTLSERTADLLANIDNKVVVKAVARHKSITASHQVRIPGSESFGADLSTKRKDVSRDDIMNSSPPTATKKTSKSIKLPEAEKLARAAERAGTKANANVRKQTEKEAEKARKSAEKERLAKEKQKATDIAEVNKSKINKKDSVTEIIVDMERCFEGTSAGTQVEEFMKQLQVQTTYFDEEVTLDDDQSFGVYGSIVKWRRKIEATYNEDMEMWEPTTKANITNEKHILIHLRAVEFASIIAGTKTSSAAPATETEMKANLDAHVQALRAMYPGHTLIYLIEGLTSWLKRNQNAKNREFTAAVRAQPSLDDQDPDLPSTSTSHPSRQRKSKKPKPPTTDLSFLTKAHIDAIQIHLQLAHQPLHIHHTTSPHTTAAQISSFTQHLSTRPYRLAAQKHNLLHASFCMDTGQIRTGDNPEDTWIRMLQEIQRVTPSMAYGIRDAGYANVRDLVRGFGKEGREMLSEVKKSMNKDGGWSERRLGPMVSKRLFKVFLGRDPESMDGIA